MILTLNDRGRALGLTTDAIARQVRGTYQGVIALRFARGDEEVTLRVRVGGRERGLAGLLETTLRTPTGGEVALSEVANVSERQAFAVLQRRDGQVSVSVTANVVPGLASVDAVIAALEAGKVRELRERYRLNATFEGRADVQRRAFRDLGLGTTIAMIAIYLILAFVFQSWSQPVLVMLVIPLRLRRRDHGPLGDGFRSGLPVHGGLARSLRHPRQRSIVLIDRMNERLADGEDLETAAVGASGDRLRALTLTTLTTVGGMAPLMLEKSLQAQFLIPVAITLSFGLAFATLLVLFLVPAVVGIADDIGRTLRAARDLLAGRDRAVGRPAE